MRIDYAALVSYSHGAGLVLETEDEQSGWCALRGRFNR
jgi:hypothetical protein